MKRIIYTGPSPRGWHRLQLAAECLQRFAWTYPWAAEGEPPPAKTPQSKKKPSPPLAKGTLVHLALAQHYARQRDGEEGWEEPATAVDLIAKLEGTSEYADVAMKAYAAHTATYGWLDREQWTVLGVEDLLSTQIADKYLLTGRADLVVEDKAGRVFVVDHKTTGRIQRSHKEFYAMSGQLLGYSHMAREKYGERFSGLLINLIEVGGTKFERFQLPRSPHLEARFEQSIVDIEESIERMVESGRSVEDWPKAMSELVCYHRYGPCKFIDKCKWGAEAKKAGNWGFAFN